MAAAILRRTLAITATAGVVLVGSPLTGAAFADSSFSGSTTSNPAPSSGVVAANRPAIVSTFTDSLGSGSTLTLVEQGTTTNLCGPKTISGSTISCTPTHDLLLGKTYDANAHGVAAADPATTADAPVFEFSVDYPKVDSSTPLANGTLVAADPTHKLSTLFSEEIDTTHGSFAVYDIINGVRGNQVPGTVGYAKSDPSPLTGTTDTITFAPIQPLPPARYQAVVHVDGVDGNGDDNPAAHADQAYDFFVDDTAPSDLAAPAIANNTNVKAVPLSGKAAPGLTVTATVGGSASNDVVVPSCGGASSCPWSLTVDVSGLPEGDLTWNAVATDPNGVSTPTSAPGPVIHKDTTAPAVPTVTAPSPSAGTTTLNVSATDASPDVASYLVTVTDPGNAHSVGPTSFTAVAHNLPQQAIDVSSLDDGTLTVSVVAVDTAGNHSNVGTASPVKNAGLEPVFADSSLTVGGSTVSFPTAASHPIQRPSAVSVRFTAPVTAQWQDNSHSIQGNGPVYTSLLQIKDVNGFAVNTGLSISPDGHTLTTTIPNPIVNGPYTVSAVAWPKAFCHDLAFNAINPPSADPNCQKFEGPITTPAGAPFTFTVDNTAPATPTVSMPSTINAIDFTTVGITGTAEPGSTVSLLIKSSAGGAPFFTQTTPDSGGNWSKVANLSTLPDGTLSVQARATDAAGNVSPAGSPNPAPKMQARPSALQAFKVASGDAKATVTFTQPATDGGSPITKYTVTYTPTSFAGPTVSTDLAPSTPGHVYSVVLPLSNGQTYAVKAFAVTAVGNGATTSGTATPRYATRLTAKPSASTVNDGATVTLSGRLTRSALDAGLTQQPLTVTPKFDNGTLGKAVPVTTDSSGNWRLSVKAIHNATYLVRFAGTRFDNAATASTRVLVRAIVKITAFSAKSASHTAPVTLKGTVAPNQAGRYVYLYEKTSTGNRSLGRVKLSSTSTWTFVHTFARGTHAVFAKFASQNGNVGNTSNLVKFARS